MKLGRERKPTKNWKQYSNWIEAWVHPRKVLNYGARDVWNLRICSKYECDLFLLLIMKSTKSWIHEWATVLSTKEETKYNWLFIFFGQRHSLEKNDYGFKSKAYGNSLETEGELNVGKFQSKTLKVTCFCLKLMWATIKT